MKNLSAMQEAWFWSLGQKDSLEKEMATYSSIPAWRNPWTEEPGELQSAMGLQRVRHDYVTEHARTNTFEKENPVVGACGKPWRHSTAGRSREGPGLNTTLWELSYFSFQVSEAPASYMDPEVDLGYKSTLKMEMRQRRA